MPRPEPGHGPLRTRRLLLIGTSVYFLLCVGGILGQSYFSAEGLEFRRGQFVTLFFVGLALILFLAPLLAIKKIISEKREQGLLQLLPDQRGSLRIALGAIASPLLATAILCLVPGLAALIVKALFGGVPAVDVLRTSLVVLAISMCAAAIGSYCSVRCKDMFSAAGFALLLVILVIFAPLWLGPVIVSTPGASFLIQPSLLINPFVGLASAMDFDLFRTEPLYQICPIGQRRFDYPSCWSVASVYVLVSLFLYWRSVVGILRMAEPSA